MADPKPNQIITCPYNKSHQIEHYRMHLHLPKCRKQQHRCNMISCPIDATHIVNDVEIDYHVTICPKRILLDSQLYVMDDDFKPYVEVQPPTVPVIPPEENWDDEATTSYKPDPTKRGPHIITKVQGATPSERRKARMEAVKNYKPRL